MDTRTGDIYNPDAAQSFKEAFPDEFEKHFIPVEQDEMTKKQRDGLKVSKHDNKSKLGKKFTSARYQRKRFWENAKSE